MSDATGEICFIDNVPISELIGEQKTPSTDNQGMSVDDLFLSAGRSQRLGIDTYENVWRPDVSKTEHFQSDAIEPLNYTVGDPAVYGRKLTTTARAQGPTVFGFAWRHMSSVDPADLTVRVTSNIEWRPNTKTYNMPSNPQTVLGREKITTSLQTLDRSHPGWDHRIVDTAKTAASRIAQAAWTGATRSLVNSAEKFAGQFAAGLLIA
jgi:hypothetical protein